MNIEQAKQEIINTVKAYTAKDTEGNYKIPQEHQRPVLLIGPPGIGKTAIMKQIAREEKIGLVEYTMTHHTRQSAIGLPILKETEFQDRKYTVTEYTMSEILASVYHCMEKERVTEGILFLDEINCVSETLAPTMLQFLQCKKFGTHILPKGWLIAAAGNPARYNKSVREFDIVTLDRVKKIEVEEVYSVWREYAARMRMHGSILAYLDLKSENFYKIEEKMEGNSFVTARGWEDLSRIVQVYEELEIPVTENLTEQYLQDKDISRDYAGFYQLYKKYQADYNIGYIFSADYSDENALFQTARFDEKMIVFHLLTDALVEKVSEYKREHIYTETLYENLKRLKQQAVSLERDFQNLLEDFIKEKKEKLKILEEQQIFSSEKIQNEKKVIHWLEAVKIEIKKQRISDGRTGIETVKDAFEHNTKKLVDMETQVRQVLENSISFVKGAAKDGQEVAIFLSWLAGNKEIMSFIGTKGCEGFLREGEVLLTERREEELKKKIRALQVSENKWL